MPAAVVVEELVKEVLGCPEALADGEWPELQTSGAPGQGLGRSAGGEVVGGSGEDELSFVGLGIDDLFDGEEQRLPGSLKLVDDAAVGDGGGEADRIVDRLVEDGGPGRYETLYNDRADSRAGRSSLIDVSMAEHSENAPRLTVLAPRDAARSARALPTDDEMAIDDLTDEEWVAFERALSER